MDKAVIFDMDGVLIDSTEAHYQAWREICRVRGIDLSRGLFLETIGTGNDVTVKIIFGCDWTPEHIAALADEKEKAYRQAIADNLVLIDGAAELVEQLDAAGWRLGLGTSAPRANVECVMERFPAASLLTVKVDADMVRAAKPAPDLFLKAAELLGVPAASCVVIEDSIAGLEAAAKAGMAGVGLTTSLDLGELASKADMVVDSLRDLTPAALAELVEETG